MSLFQRLKNLMAREPREQILGYSRPELQAIFTAPLPSPAPILPALPHLVPLAHGAVQAYYCALLIDAQDLDSFQALVACRFALIHERRFNDLPVRQYANAPHDRQLISLVSTREFNAVTLRLVTNCPEFLEAIHRQRFAVPPPWIAFEGYPPAWWGESLQGAQGYYNDQYFLPFFTGLSETEKLAYYARYSATQEWTASLLSVGDEQEEPAGWDIR
ncbi:hypothetical protein [Pseudomonas chlororaphis]|uniref:Uncharacterized protein n=1 Tax=Pseudomonas chlororaphis TaxID=587753 RepID=A0A0D5Y2I2_9PSED|nr:hypothetical protein [Pseudomonas chlororaphis]AKA25245.1 hypothetical protein PCL1606_37940 [Pseudomonas chlororaphis]